MKHVSALAFVEGTIDEYLWHWKYRERKYKHEQRSLFCGALGFLTAGLVALYVGSIVFAVALLAIAAFFHRGSSQKELMGDMMKEHYYLAWFIAAQQASDSLRDTLDPAQAATGIRSVSETR